MWVGIVELCDEGLGGIVCVSMLGRENTYWGGGVWFGREFGGGSIVP